MKNFKKNNPALNYISAEEDTIEDIEVLETSDNSQEVPKGYKLNPKYIECKSKRVQVLMQPSVHNAIKEIARMKNISTNEAINEALKAYVEKED